MINFNKQVLRNSLIKKQKKQKQTLQYHLT
jgi:hypothetical protein